MGGFIRVLCCPSESAASSGKVLSPGTFVNRLILTGKVGPSFFMLTTVSITELNGCRSVVRGSNFFLVSCSVFPTSSSTVAASRPRLARSDGQQNLCHQQPLHGGITLYDRKISSPSSLKWTASQLLSSGHTLDVASLRVSVEQG